MAGVVTLKLISTAPAQGVSAFASMIAARKVQMPLPAPVSQTPSPALASGPSPVLLTVKLAGQFNAKVAEIVWFARTLVKV